MGRPPPRGRDPTASYIPVRSRPLVRSCWGRGIADADPGSAPPAWCPPWNSVELRTLASPAAPAPGGRTYAGPAPNPASPKFVRSHAGHTKGRRHGSRRVFLVEAPGIEPGDEPEGPMRGRYGGRRVGRVGALSGGSLGSVPLVYPSALSWSPVP